MASITLGGINTGLPPNLVEQIIEAEKAPVKNMQVRKERDETKLGLVNDLDTKLKAIENSLGTLASVKGFNDIKLESGDSNIITGTADLSAPKGSWNVEVIQLAQKAAAITNGFPDRDKAQIGTGYFKFNTQDGEKEVFINNSNNTLDAAAAAINSAGIGIKASVINDRKDSDNPYKLMLSGANVGGDNNIEYPTLYFLDGDQDLYFDKETEAQNGIIKLDGFELEINGNTVTDAIPGVALDIRQAAPGRQVNVTIKENREAVSGKINDFVKSMNDVLSFIQSQNQMNDKTDTSRTLGGDQIIRMVESRLRRLIQDPQYGVGGDITRLSQMGIEITRSGTLKLNEDKFNQTLASKPDHVKRFFAGDGFKVGFIPAVRKEIGVLTNSAFGAISNRKRALEDGIRRTDDNIANKEKALVRREEQLRRQFANLEETMGRLKQQGTAVGSMAQNNLGLNLSGAQLHT
ncbi:MAG: flagellar hook associated protein [Bdellovibrionales bacterium RBG_16_40_8]|nr:MAG: flagellar hook associated protein [Bdellovibrionales bacterium RBG_16_40_8]